MAGSLTEAGARNILGEKFLSKAEVSDVWRNKSMETPDNDCQIVYRQDVVEESVRKDSSLYLIYDPGFSLSEMGMIFEMHDFSERAYGHDWLDKKESPSYQLVSLKPVLEEKIAEMADDFRRPPTRLIISIQISCFLLFGELIAEELHLLGSETANIKSSKVTVGCMSNFDGKSILLYNQTLGLVLPKRPHFPSRKIGAIKTAG